MSMALTSAIVTNFKLLKNIKVNFSEDGSKPLTVIRAENASGKTSLMTALKWGLFGNEALEDKTVPFTSAHWPIGQPCDITVDLIFTYTTVSIVGSRRAQQTRKYRLQRSVSETVTDGKPKRTDEKISLYELTNRGAQPQPTPEQLLGQMLNSDLRDVFFTNGDAAMNFISPQNPRIIRRSQVQNSLRALLEIGVIEDGIKHVKSAQADLRKQSAPAGSDLADLAERLDDLEKRLEGLQAAKQRVTSELDSLVTRQTAADCELQDALKLGDHHQLATLRETAEKQKELAQERLADMRKQHQALFSSEALSWSLVDAQLRDGVQFLQELRDAGVIPKTVVPVLRDRLLVEKCICGESLAHGTPARRAVEAEISRQMAPDATQERLSRLYHLSSNDIDDRDLGRHNWHLQLDTVLDERLSLERALDEASSLEAFNNKKLEMIKLADVEEKRERRKSLDNAIVNKRDEQQEIDINIHSCDNELKSKNEEYQKARKRDLENRALNAKFTATQDVLSVLVGVLEELQGNCRAKVSALMNDLFCQMIASDVDASEEMRAITSASITPNFDIEVQAGHRTLHPDHELNGASQRALTFAFIWALIEVSGKVAPRVIDTPLGMMSGGVKRRVLEIMASRVTANQPDRQVIMFLTRSEIAQVEDLLDARAGVVFTLTNTRSGDLTRRLSGEGEPPQIVRCECNHRQYCAACSRRDDAQYGLSHRLEA